MRYLSAEWFEAAAAGIDAAGATSAEPASFSYAVRELPPDHPHDSDVVRYQISVDASSARIEQTDEPGDVSFSLTYAVALQIASGWRSGSRAFLDGDVQVGGNVSVLIERARDLEVLSSHLPVVSASDA